MLTEGSNNVHNVLEESLIEVIEETLEEKIANAHSIVIPTFERYQELYKKRLIELYDEFKLKKEQVEDMLFSIEQIFETLDKLNKNVIKSKRKKSRAN